MKNFILAVSLATFGLFASLNASPAGQSGGKALFGKRCGGCHALDRDKEGPRLGGVWGRSAGSVGSFQYSDALRKSEIKWTSEALDQWLADPDSLVPNNNMAFHVEGAEERSQIIEYLKQQSGR